jgi:glucose/arabinose dehydrogenase
VLAAVKLICAGTLVLVACALPAGASAAPQPHVVVTGIPSPSNLVFDGHGRLWVTSGSEGAGGRDGVWFVPKQGRPRHVTPDLPVALGLRWSNGRLYVSHVTSATNGRVTSLWGFDGRAFRHRAVALDHLVIGEHRVDSIVRGRGGRLFVGIGSTADHDGRTGRVVSFAPPSHAARLEATGLRNPFGLVFYGRRLLVTDNGRDDLGPFQPPDELDAFDPVGPRVDFGFPDCYDQGGPPCAGTRPPLMRFAPHASSDGIAVKGHVAYVAENGSSFPANPTGSDIQRVDLRTGRHSLFWASPVQYDPVGAAIGPDGDLYVTLYRSGSVVRFDL